MQIFLDTANIEEIREAVSWGVVDGVTTNPSLMMKQGTSDLKAVTVEICELVQGPVSAEVVSTDADGMVREAKEIAGWHEHIVIKIPTIREGHNTAVRHIHRPNVERRNPGIFRQLLSLHGYLLRYRGRLRLLRTLLSLRSLRHTST